MIPLDTAVSAAVLALSAALRREAGLSCRFIGHGLHTVRFVCDEIVGMPQGCKFAQVTGAGRERGPSRPCCELRSRSLSSLRQGWLDEQVALNT